jgi:hypothetical protein
MNHVIMTDSAIGRIAHERTPPRPLVILVAGQYWHDTGHDPAWPAQDTAAIRRAAWQIFQAGHVPVVVADVALSLAVQDGSRHYGGRTANEVVRLLARRLLVRCDAVLRVDGPSDEADELVRLARWEGKRVFNRHDDLPGAARS